MIRCNYCHHKNPDRMNYCLNCGEPLGMRQKIPPSNEDLFSETELNLITLTYIFVSFSWFYMNYKEFLIEISELLFWLFLISLFMFLFPFYIFFDISKKFIESIVQGLNRKDAARIAFFLAFLASFLSWRIENGILLARSALILLIFVPFFDWINIIPVSEDSSIGKVIYPIIEMIIAAIFSILIKSLRL